MYINKKSSPPPKQEGRNVSMYVFVYYTNNRRFCFGYFDYANDVWMDSDGMVITDNLLWCYLPVKQMKAYINSMKTSENYPY